MRQETGRETPDDGDAALRLSGDEALLQNLVENSAVPTFLAGGGGRVFYANHAFGTLLGYTPAEIVKLELGKIVHPEDAEAAREQSRALAGGEIKRYDAERRYIRKDGSPVWVIVSALPLTDKRSGKFYITVQAVDIDRQKHAEAALTDSERRWNSALECAGQGVWDHDLKNRKVFYSRMWRQMRGFEPDEVIDSSAEAWLARVHPDDRERVLNESRRQDSGELKRNDFEYRERHRDGHYVWILSRGKPVDWMPDGSVARIIGTDTDITSLKEAEARAADEAAETYRRHLTALEKAHEATEAARQLAQSMARHDALTGLPNRRVFSETLETAVARAARGTARCAVLIVDLDRFKPVNDLHGHAAGDTVLNEIASRLAKLGRKEDTTARFGGDEFGIILDCAGSEDPATVAAAYADRVGATVALPLKIGEQSVTVGASVGIAICPTDGTDPDTLLRAADMAMYRAKDEGRGSYCFFRPTMEAALRDRIALEDDARQAVAREEIVPHYQPLMKLAEDRLVGFEILARWRHPTRGNVEPDTFIPIVEKLGLIGELTYSLLRCACTEARDWPREVTLALNISPTHLSDPLMPVKLLAILSETGFAPSRLEVEVTETALVADMDAARTALKTLQSLGIKISLDDFGVGYSSLYNLRELHFDKIKIDRSFVLSMQSNPGSAKIVHSVIELAKSLGLPTIAEGIEHQDALRQIMRSGGEYGQGFYFGKAMPAAKASELVRSRFGGFGTVEKIA